MKREDFSVLGGENRARCVDEFFWLVFRVQSVDATRDRVVDQHLSVEVGLKEDKDCCCY